MSSLYSLMKKNPLLTILLVALILRAALPLASWLMTGTTSQFHCIPPRDTPTYVDSAASLLKTGNFSRCGIPEISRTPGYPLFLIPGLLSGHMELVTICLQIMVSVLTVYLVYLTALTIFDSSRAALLSSALYSAEILSIFYVTHILTETLFTALVMMFAYFFVRYLRYGARAMIILSAAAVSAAVYVRPAGYLLPLLTAVLLLSRLFSRGIHSRRLITDALVFFSLCIVLIGPWQIRNYFKTNYWGFSTIAVKGLYFYTGPQILAAKFGGNWEVWREKIGFDEGGGDEAYFSVHPEQRIWALDQIMKWRLKETSKLIFDNPITFVRLYLIGTAYTAMGPGMDSYYQLFQLDVSPKSTENHETQNLSFEAKLKTFFSRPPGFVFLQMFFFGILAIAYSSAVYGILAAFKIRSYEICFIVLFVAYLIAVPGTMGHTRFRTPAMPLICVLSGYGLSQIVSKLKARPMKFSSPKS